MWYEGFALVWNSNSQTHYNSSSLNKRNVTVFGRVILVNNFFLRFFLCPSSPNLTAAVLVLIEKIYQILRAVFDHISKHLDFRQKYSAARLILNSLLGV